MENIHGGDIYGIEDFIDFSANINPLGTPQSVKDAVFNELNNIMNYPDIYCRKLRNKLEKNYNINKDYIICGNGASDLIYRFVYALRPKKALVVAPSFAEYEQALKSTEQVDIVYYKLNHKDFCVHKEIIDYITEDLDVLFLCNPNNPTGICIPEPLLGDILEKCEEKNVFVLLDECFLDFLYNEREISYLEKVNKYSRLFILRAFTKMYAVAGLRLGFGVSSNRWLIEKMYTSGASWNVSSVAQAAGLAALDEVDIVEKTRQYIKQEKEFLYKGLSSLGISFINGEANYIFFKACCDLKYRLLQKGILIRDCSNYKNLEKGYFRIAVKTREENEKLLSAMKQVLQGYSK